jgi:hypothetical protein
MACKLKVLEPRRVLSNGGSKSLYKLYAALVAAAQLQAIGGFYLLDA